MTTVSRSEVERISWNIHEGIEFVEFTTLADQFAFDIHGENEGEGAHIQVDGYVYETVNIEIVERESLGGLARWHVVANREA